MTPELIFAQGIPIWAAYKKYARIPASKIDKSAGNDLPVGYSDLPKAEQFSYIADQVIGLLGALGAPWENFSKQLISGRLLAVGFKSPRNLGDPPVLVPRDIWESGKIDPELSSIKGAGLEFVSVRIMRVSKKYSNNIVPAKPQNIGNSKSAILKVGRKSLSREILIAYEKLKNERKIAFAEPMTHSYERIRMAVKELFPECVSENKGLGDEAIRKVIAQDFHQMSVASKVSSKL